MGAHKENTPTKARSAVAQGNFDHNLSSDHARGLTVSEDILHKVQSFVHFLIKKNSCFCIWIFVAVW